MLSLNSKIDIRIETDKTFVTATFQITFLELCSNKITFCKRLGSLGGLGLLKINELQKNLSILPNLERNEVIFQQRVLVSSQFQPNMQLQEHFVASGFQPPRVCDKKCQVLGRKTVNEYFLLLFGSAKTRLKIILTVCGILEAKFYGL